MTVIDVATQKTAEEIKSGVNETKAGLDAINVNVGNDSDAASASGKTAFSILKYIAITLATVWTTGRAALLDMLPNLDATISSRADKTDAANIYNLVAQKAAQGTADAIYNLINSRIGYIDQYVSTRAAQSTADAIKAKTDLIGDSSASGSVSKSIQRGVVTMPVAGVTNYNAVDIAIAPVNPSKCSVILTGVAAQSGGTVHYFPRVANFTSSVLTIQRDGDSNATYLNKSFAYEIVEYY